MKTIEINGEKYVKVNADEHPYVIVRTQNAGVFAGNLLVKEGNEVKLSNARRIWYWDGAASLSELAMHGTCKPENCKFPCEVDSVVLLEVIEILDTTEKAEKSIKGVKVWSASQE